MSMKGIDVSRWQGTINWPAVKAAGIKFAIIKAGGSDKGFYKDPQFEANYAGAKSAGIHVGAYYFVGPGCKSRADGEADARRFLAFLSGKQFDMPVYIDFEAPNATNKNGNTEACIGFCRVMEQAGYFAGVYASDLSGFHDRLNRDSLKPFTWWVARYGSKCTWATANLGIWQYSSSGRVNGISGDVDMDECYIDYPTTIRNGGFNGYKVGAKPAAPAPKPAPAPAPVSSGIKVGDRVKVINPVTWTGQRFKLWYSTYTVMELNGQRAVIGVNGTVTAAISVKNLKKA